MAAIFVLTRHTNSYWNIEFYRCYLAVDLFFILSGFVIAHAYDKKLEDKILSFSKFSLIRIIRLYPVFLLSVILCSILLISDKKTLNFSDISEITWVISLTAFLIPSHLTGKPELFTLNGPYWSLFYELIVNLIYAAIRPILTNLILLIIVITSGILITFVSYFHTNLDAGFFFSTKSFVAGFSRSIFGIFTGILLYRHHLFLEKKLIKFISPWFAFFLIAIILASPNAANYNWAIDATIVCLVFPFCVLTASKNVYTKLESALLMLGSASYPLYVLHKPVGELISKILNGFENLYAPFSGFIFTIFIITISIYIEKYYDIPVRKRISNYFKTKTNIVPHPPLK